MAGRIPPALWRRTKVHTVPTDRNAHIYRDLREVELEAKEVAVSEVRAPAETPTLIEAEIHIEEVSEVEVAPEEEADLGAEAPVEESPAFSMLNSKAELTKAALDMGIELDPSHTKREILALITQA